MKKKNLSIGIVWFFLTILLLNACSMNIPSNGNDAETERETKDENDVENNEEISEPATETDELPLGEKFIYPSKAPANAELSLGGGKFSQLEYSPDGKYLALLGAMGVYVYDIDRGEISASWMPSMPPTRIAFSPNGAELAIGDLEGMITYWDYQNDEVNQKIAAYPDVTEYQEGDISLLEYSPDGSRIASVGIDQGMITLKLWDTVIGDQIEAFNSAWSGGFDIEYSPDGAELVMHNFSVIEFLNSNSGKTIRKFTFDIETIDAVEYSPDGQFVAIQSLHSSLMLMEAHSGNIVWETETIEGKRPWSIDYSPDGNSVVTGNSDGSITLWNTADGSYSQSLKLVNNAISSISFSPSGSTIACLSQNGDVFLWDVETSTSDQILEGHAVASNVVYSPDGKYLASGDLSGRVIIWHSDTGNVMKTLYGVESPVASIDYSLDSSTLAVGYEDGSISLWDVFAGKIISTFSGHSSSIVHLLFSPDGKTIASSGNDRNILWEVSSGEILYFGEHGGSHLAFSPDGKLLGLNCGGEIWLVDLSTYEEIQFHEVSLDTETFKFSAPLIVGIVFGKNSEVIAAETDVGTKLILFDILTKEEIINVEFTMDGSAQYAIDYSPVDNMFAVADGIGNVYIYGASTGSEIELFDAVHKVEGRGPSVRRLTFSPDGKQIATCLDNGIIVIWNLDQ